MPIRHAGSNSLERPGLREHARRLADNHSRFTTDMAINLDSSGIGWMIWDAAKFLLSDVVIMGLIVLGLTGVLLDLAMRAIAKLLMPWS